MISKYGFGQQLYGHEHLGMQSKKASPFRVFGRVVDVILDSSHPKYEEYGQTLALNGVFYVPLGQNSTEDINKPIEFAYSGEVTFQKVPLKSEIVLITKDPSAQGREDNYTTKKSYWTKIVPLWNHPQHNAYPDTLQFGNGPVDLGPGFIESSNIAPLRKFLGDVLIEGRQGESLRFTSVKDRKTPWMTKSAESALAYLRVGQPASGDGNLSVLEDINKDESSLVLTSNHSLPLQNANRKVNTWKVQPLDFSQYNGAQFVINSDRVVINAKNEHILLSSKQSIGLSGISINIDGNDYIGLDANKIYLGRNAIQTEHEPNLLGQTTVEWLSDFTTQFEHLITELMSLPASPSAAIPKIIASASSIKPMIPHLRARLDSLKSKKVYTE